MRAARNACVGERPLRIFIDDDARHRCLIKDVKTAERAATDDAGTAARGEQQNCYVAAVPPGRGLAEGFL